MLTHGCVNSEVFSGSNGLLQLPYSRQFKGQWVPVHIRAPTQPIKTSRDVASQTVTCLCPSAWGCESG